MKKIIKNIFILSFAAGVIFVVYILFTLPNISEFTYRPQTKSVLMSADNVKIGEIASKNVTYIAREDIPDMLIKAVVSVEDKRFYDHFGVDVRGIFRAFYVNLREGEIVEGGSTITQQTASMLFFNKSKSYIRKIKEAFTAIKMEAKYSKDEIVTMYLNEVYLGGGAYGVYEASQTYFSKEPKNLSLEECAVLAGILQAPSAYSPLTEEGYVFAMERKDKVLDLMSEQGFISEEEAAQAKAKKVKIKPSSESAFANGVCNQGYEAYCSRVYDQTLEMLTKHFMDTYGYKKDEAESSAHNTLFLENTTVNVTLSDSVQKSALSAMNKSLSGKSELADCAFVFLNSENGDIVAYYGSDAYIDMAQKPRQPGSTIKPLYMSYLIESGLADRNTVVNDERFDLNGYSPANSGKYFGYVTMRETLVNSLNSASLRLFAMADQDNLIAYVQSLGISTIRDVDHNAAFALGGLTDGIKPVEMSLAYALINNGGTLYSENYIKSIVLSDGTIVFPEKNGGKRVMSAGTAGQIKSCLESTVLRGTASAADPGYATMGKTGTTDNNRDVWFAGATANISGSIWIGNIDSKAVKNISNKWCLPIYKSALTAAIKNKAVDSSQLSSPKKETMTKIDILKDESLNKLELTKEDVISVDVPAYEVENFADRQVVEVVLDSESGMLFVEGKCPEENKTTAIFRKGNEPTEYCDKWHWLTNPFGWDRNRDDRR